MSQQLEDVHRRFQTAFNAGDVEALVSLYEADAILSPERGKTARGKDEIRATYQQFVAGRPTIRLETTAAWETADGLGLMHGRWTISAKGEDGAPVEVNGISAEVLRRQTDGRWLYIIDNPFAG